MKTRLSQICIAITMLLSVGIASAQEFGPGNAVAGGQAAFQAVQGDLLQPGLPGRLWFRASFADQGLGFNGSYLTLGGKTRLFQDRLDGRWLFEGQLNQSIDDGGGFFANVGVQRVFSIEPANADIVFGGWYDYDGDDQQSFSDGFNQLGITAAIKSRRADLIANGYFPINTKSFSSGDLTGQQIFSGNNIILQPGLENALQGFDVTLRTRPKQLAFVNGFVDLGGYHYDSEDDLVDSFAGGRLRVGIQMINSLRITAEVNQDERFDTTGVLSASWTFGNTNSGFGSEYAGLARDLERTVRNDHIVRFSQDLVVAINPLTGQPFNVVHANNTQEGTGDGTAESPFATLAQAEAAAGITDVIFVDVGDGTSTGYDTGITLQDNQQLLSSGGTQFIQAANGTNVALSTNGIGATITNPGGDAVVTLADSNVIGGINIAATGSNFGVFGAETNGDLFVNSTTITGATKDGVKLENFAGNLSFAGSTFSDNGQDGVFVNGSTNPAAVFSFTNNTIENNAFEGIRLLNYDAASVVLTGNNVSNNGRHGVYLENALDSNGDGTDILLTSHTANSNGDNGVFIENGNGNILVEGGTFDSNAVNGLRIDNWRTEIEGDSITIAALEDGTQATFSNSPNGVFIDTNTPGLNQTINVTGATFDNNIRGILAQADGAGIVQNLNVTGTTTFTNNLDEAVAHIVTGGATVNSVIEGTEEAPIIIADPNLVSAFGSILYQVDGDDPANRSTINGLVRNANINVNGESTILALGTGESVLNLVVEDSLLQTTGSSVVINLDNNTGGLLNQTFFDNVDIRGNTGVSVVTAPGTLLDFSLTDSLVRSGGIISDDSAPFSAANPAAFGPFTDQNGSNGILVSADGALLTNPDGTTSSDNFTRISLVGNTIEDFTFDGIVLQSTGEARLVADFRSNNILRNGPGQDDDGTTDDGVPDGTDPAVNPDVGFFFDGLDVTASGNSEITLTLEANGFLNNFQRSIDLTTNDTATINSSLISNRVASDIGTDGTMVSLDLVDGQIGVQNNGGLINLDLSENNFTSPFFDVQNNTMAPATLLPIPTAIRIGFDGLTNGSAAITDVPGVFTPTPFGLTNLLVAESIADFDAAAGIDTTEH